MSPGPRYSHSIDRALVSPLPARSSLFVFNKESMEDMLTRKFRLKYIDNNPAFANDPWVLSYKVDDTMSKTSHRNSKILIGERTIRRTKLP